MDCHGTRCGNEDVYGATLADYLIQNHDGQGWLVVDHEIFEEAVTQATVKHEQGSEDALHEDQNNAISHQPFQKQRARRDDPGACR